MINKHKTTLTLVRVSSNTTRTTALDSSHLTSLKRSKVQYFYSAVVNNIICAELTELLLLTLKGFVLFCSVLWSFKTELQACITWGYAINVWAFDWITKQVSKFDVSLL